MSENIQPLAIVIRPAEQAQLDFLEAQFSPQSMAKHHHTSYAVQQRDEGLFLVAWHGQTPVGHFLLWWEGTEHETARGYPLRTPYLQAGGTREEYRRQGVATRLIAEAEYLVYERGYRRIGLAVGSNDNPTARRLYERLGYRDWGKGEFTETWEYARSDGRRGTESEVCIYMLKEL